MGFSDLKTRHRGPRIDAQDSHWSILPMPGGGTWSRFRCPFPPFLPNVRGRQDPRGSGTARWRPGTGCRLLAPAVETRAGPGLRWAFQISKPVTAVPGSMPKILTGVSSQCPAAAPGPAFAALSRLSCRTSGAAKTLEDLEQLAGVPERDAGF